MSADHSNTKKEKVTHVKLVTKVAFLAVVTVFILSLMKLWTDMRYSGSPTSENSDISTNQELKATFAKVLPQLHPDSYFGRQEKEDGFYVTVAGYVGEMGTIENQEVTRDRVSIYAIRSEEEYPLYLLFGDDEAVVPVTQKGSEKTLTVKKLRKSLKPGQPIVLTVYFENELYYLTALTTLEDLDDYIRFGIRKPNLDVVLDTQSIVSLEFL